MCIACYCLNCDEKENNDLNLSLNLRSGHIAWRHVGTASPYPTQQRTNAENSKQIFPQKELRGQSPNFHIHVSVSSLHFPTIDLAIVLKEICGQILGIYKSSQTHECGNWDWVRAIPRKGRHKWDFRCSALRILQLGNTVTEEEPRRPMQSRLC